MADDTQQPSTPAPDLANGFSPDMYDHDTKTWVQVPADKVRDAVLSGRFTFQSGIRIPVVNARGESGTISSDDARHEFENNGVQWLTPQRQTVAEGAANEKILASHFADQPLTAAALGIARMGTLGASDVGLSALGAGDAAAQVGERNPVATFGGEALGTVLPSAAGNVVARGAGAALGAGVEAAESAGLLGKTAATVLKPAAQFAGEGAVYGFGAGVTEQALGHPDDVLDNLASHVGWGALVGGGLGGVMGGAEVTRPFFDRVVEKAAQGGRDLVDQLASKTMAKGITAVASKTMEEQAAKDFGALATDPDFMRAYAANGAGAVKEAAAEHASTVATARQTMKDLESDIRETLKGASQQSKADVADAVSKAGGDIFHAIEDAHQQYTTVSENFDNILTAMRDQPFDGGKLADKFEGLVDDFKASSNKIAQNVGAKIEAHMAAADLTSEGGQAAFFYRLRNVADGVNREGLSQAERNALDKIIDEADHTLLNDPNHAISKGYEAVRSAEHTLDHLEDIGHRTIFRVTDRPLVGEDVSSAFAGEAPHVVSADRMLKTLVKPEMRDAVNATFDHLAEIAPEVKQYAAGLKTIDEKIAFQNQLEAKLAVVTKGGRIDGAAVQDVLEILGNPKELAAKLDKLTEIQSSLQQASPIQRILAAKQALGEPISKDLEHLASLEQKFALFNKFKDTPMPGVSPLKAAAGAVFGHGGGFVKHVAGAMLGMRQTTAGEYLRVLGGIQKASQKGADLLERSIKGAADSLTKGTAGKVAKAATYASFEGPTVTRKNYQQTKQQLASYTPPQQHALSAYSAPLAQAAMARETATAQFLASKLPQDPFQQTSISPNKTGYIPSDHDLAKFNRYAAAANNPLQVLDKIAKGKVSVEEMETLKTLHPNVYQKLQTHVIDSIIEKRADLSYKQKVQLSQLFDIPADYTLTPAFTARMQMSLNQDQGGRPQGAKSTSHTIKLDIDPNNSVMTESQRIANGIKR